VAVWPAQIALYAAAAVCIGLIVRRSGGANQFVSALLALLWAWLGAVVVPRASMLSGTLALLAMSLSLVQAVLIFRAGVLERRLTFRPPDDGASMIGTTLLLYALTLHPMIAAALGRQFPDVPTFGIAVPTTVFTLGLLLWAERPIPRRLLVVPAISAVTSGIVALRFAMWEDLVVLPLTLIATVALVPLPASLGETESE
jgi:hypothetical protein